MMSLKNFLVAGAAVVCGTYVAGCKPKNKKSLKGPQVEDDSEDGIVIDPKIDVKVEEEKQDNELMQDNPKSAKTGKTSKKLVSAQSLETSVKVEEEKVDVESTPKEKNIVQKKKGKKEEEQKQPTKEPTVQKEKKKIVQKKKQKLNNKQADKKQNKQQ